MNQTEIMQRWTTYCGELYQEQVDEGAREKLIKELNEISPPFVERQDDILIEEVEAAVRRLKNNEAPGMDNATSEMIKYGGEIMIKELHELCNIVWKEGKAPDD